jgi:hypothetical protein
MSTQPESQQQPVPEESGGEPGGAMPTAQQEPSRPGGEELDSIFGIKDSGSDIDPPPWTGPPPPPAG